MLKSATGERNEGMVRYLMEIGALKSSGIIRAFRAVDRVNFVPRAYASYAYEDNPIKTVGDSTISQPYTVAVMVEELGPKTGDKILEVGTGSGYNACILAECVGPEGRVVSIEMDRKVAEFGSANIKEAKVVNITLVEEDGFRGYPELAPYDRIVYTCAIPEVPKEVLEQMKVGGRIVAPVGDGPQMLTSITRVSEAEFVKKEMGYFKFVPVKTLQ